MRVQFDLPAAVVFFVDRDHRIVGGSRVAGITELVAPGSAVSYTLGRFLVSPGQCALCDAVESDIGRACVSRTGLHAIVAPSLDIAPEQRAEHWRVQMVALEVDGLTRYVAPDNLFPLEEAAEGYSV